MLDKKGFSLAGSESLMSAGNVSLTKQARTFYSIETFPSQHPKQAQPSWATSNAIPPIITATTGNAIGKIPKTQKFSKFFFPQKPGSNSVMPNKIFCLWYSCLAGNLSCIIVPKKIVLALLRCEPSTHSAETLTLCPVGQMR
jgi:hypothetical protein